MNDIIFHHYDISPYSEKIRLAFGLKNVSWRSVIVPEIAPKPDLEPLTGGYRHTPVLQVGADVFCDTRLILEEIERRFPDPPLWRAETEGMARAIESWAERDFFWAIANFITGANVEHLSPEFLADRSEMRGRPCPPAATWKKAGERGRIAFLAQLPMVESMLADGRDFILGDAVSLADLAVYHGLWFLKVFPRDCSGHLEPFGRLSSWMSRIAAIGHGERVETDPQQALQVAYENVPGAISSADQGRSIAAPGLRVSIRPEGYACAPVEGELVATGANRITIRRTDPRVGVVNVHFPRMGYVLKEL